MKKILFIFIYYFSFLHSYAADAGILSGGGMKTVEDIRNGNIHIADFPNMIRHIINIALALVGTVSLVFIIVGAYQIVFGSLTDNKTKGKETVMMALAGFILASLAWFIVKLVLDNIT